MTGISSLDGDPLRLVLELRRGTEPITGRLCRADGDSWQFTGWVQLTRALEEACAESGTARSQT